MSDNHYFNQDPQSPSKRKTISVRLAEKDLELFTDSGVFSPAGIDKGTQVLLKQAHRASDHGTVIDLGAGWGPVSFELAIRNPELNVIAVEVNTRAVELIRENSVLLGLSNVNTLPLSEIKDESVDQIWSNPPIRIGKKELHGLLREAFAKLKPSAQAFLVVQKHLGSDSLAKWIEQDLGFEVERLDNSKGFRVFQVTKR